MFSTSGQNFRDLSHHNSENLREIRKSSQMQHSEKGKIQSATTTTNFKFLVRNFRKRWFCIVPTRFFLVLVKIPIISKWWTFWVKFVAYKWNYPYSISLLNYANLFFQAGLIIIRTIEQCLFARQPNIG
jgi:hypothetical protein